MQALASAAPIGIRPSGESLWLCIIYLRSSLLILVRCSFSMAARSKIVKAKGTEPDEFEDQVASYLYELEQNVAELKAELRPLHISAAKEVSFSFFRMVYLLPYTNRLPCRSMLVSASAP